MESADYALVDWLPCWIEGWLAAFVSLAVTGFMLRWNWTDHAAICCPLRFEYALKWMLICWTRLMFESVLEWWMLILDSYHLLLLDYAFRMLTCYAELIELMLILFCSCCTRCWFFGADLQDSLWLCFQLDADSAGLVECCWIYLWIDFEYWFWILISWNDARICFGVDADLLDTADARICFGVMSICWTLLMFEYALEWMLILLIGSLDLGIRRYLSTDYAEFDLEFRCKFDEMTFPSIELSLLSFGFLDFDYFAAFEVCWSCTFAWTFLGLCLDFAWTLGLCLDFAWNLLVWTLDYLWCSWMWICCLLFDFGLTYSVGLLLMLGLDFDIFADSLDL